MEFVFVLVGLLGLWLGTKWVIRGAFGISDRYALSHSFVGLGILAIGTDLPELFVTLKAAWLNYHGTESSGIITGNAIGSSIAQMSVILGISSLFVSFNIGKKDLIRDGLALILSIILLFFLGRDGVISRMDGLAMLVLYVTYYISLLKGHSHLQAERATLSLSVMSIALYLIVGFLTLIIGSHFMVENSMTLAKKWGVDQSFVGIVLIGLGTSLPELAVSVGAALRRSAGMSVGNLIGSNIFDGLIPIGLGGVISPVKIENTVLWFDVPSLSILTLAVLIMLGTKRGISKPEGAFLIMCYLMYVLIRAYQ